MAMHTSTVSRKPAPTGMPATAIRAAITPPRLAMLPTDKSNSFTTITMVAPMEIMVRAAICRLILIKFFRVRKAAGFRTPNIMMITRSAIMVP